ncbi:hypothetical protein F3087_44840 [Nocardia colli]|uniref:CoA transferase n=1 Tax=Nocardia colli TaxID=2545717 RepID=A0A5N0DMH8_9NOCA|nr:CoA transferase [Nocardia colli]KAA8877305.1 hypothetical protein F3087_44840 [Nocardia colli]
MTTRSRPTTAGPLDGIRVIEWGGGIAAGFCTHLLAGYGADVLQLGGSDLPPDHDQYLSRGKRRVIDGDAVIEELLDQAHVVVDSRSRAGSARIAPSAEQISHDHPGLVVTAITPFGLTGPYANHRATNIVSFAAGGIMALTGERDSPPLQSGGEQAFMLGGLQAFAATSTALFGLRMQGVGDLIDISLQECAASILEAAGPAWEYDGLFFERSGNTPRAEWGMYRASDGWIGVCCLARQLPAFLEMIGVTAEPRFMDTARSDADNHDLRQLIAAYMSERTQQEIVSIGPKFKVPVGAVKSVAAVAEHAPLIDRGFFDDTAYGRLPGRLFPGLPWADLEPPTEVPIDTVLTEWLDKDGRTP